LAYNFAIAPKRNEFLCAEETMNRFDEYEQQRMVSLLGLRAFPRSLGMIVGAITLLVTKDPFNALEVGLGTWFVTYLIKSTLSPDIVGTYLWSCCSLPVNAIGAYPIRWLLYIVLVIIALATEAPFTLSLIIMGGLLLYDIIIVFTRGS
jgi:hypothetical protein